MHKFGIILEQWELDIVELLWDLDKDLAQLDYLETRNL